MSHWDPVYGAPSQGYQQSGNPPGTFYNNSHYNNYYQGYSQNQQQQQTSYHQEARNSGNNTPINNVNSQGSNQLDYNNQYKRTNSNNVSHVDVTNSNLQATAMEFRPGSSYSVNNGAVRRDGQEKPQTSRSRVFSSKSEGQRWGNRYNSRHEQDKAIKETADILNKIKCDGGDAQPSASNTGKRFDKNKDRTKNKYKNEFEKPKGHFKGNNETYYNNHYKDNWFNKKRNDRRPENWRRDRTQRKENDDDDLDVRPEKDFVEKVEKYNKPQHLKKKLDAASQRERLEQMVTHRLLECLVCCERLRHSDKIWSCKQCYHIFHLNCIIRWAKASKTEESWRCPACQNVSQDIPKEYRCYCDKFSEPKIEPGLVPHSCGEMCARKGRSCEHTCTLLCHPGPCPDCNASVARACGCGSTKPTVKCSSDLQITCQNVCSKSLNCGVHQCASKCHVGPCEDCTEKISQDCFCGKNGREVECTAETQGVEKFECGNDCVKTLACGNHCCMKLCHADECDSCPSDPMVIKTCPCGQTKLKEERKSCLDPIPCCDKVCNKTLKCGQPSDPHLCKEKCHDGPCPPCLLSTMVRCRCGHMDKELSCKDLRTKADDARCQKKCTKKRLCCKHKCNQFCCIELDHPCPLPCNHQLSCGLHRCEENCHRGRCPPCWRTSFQELYCECGSSVLYPPVACGTRPPPCNKPCSRRRPCNHEPHHNCHTGSCPPCTVFTQRFCHCKSESRQTIPCYQEDFSCGRPCNKDMVCGRHKCNQTCHKGDCPMPCSQPCLTTRASCEHPCYQPCHEPPCPNIPCKQNVTVTCQCGLRTSSRVCVDLAGDYQKIAMSQLASKMADIQRGQTFDISDIVNKKGNSHKTLECNEECRLVERNRRLAIGLQIRNPDLSAKLMPRYSDYMKMWAKKDSRFCVHIHDKLTELVQLAKQSKQKSRSHSFECMNREKRHFVHEYCEHFGCDSVAYDKEPNRNIVATAYRDKSWLPSISLIEFLQRENGQRKVPGPILNKPDMSRASMSRTNEVVSVKLQSRLAPRPVTPPVEFVDYFENPP